MIRPPGKNEKPQIVINGSFANLKIGKNVAFHPFSMPYFDTKGSEIHLREGVAFGSGTYVHTHTHRFERSNWRDFGDIRTDDPTVINKCAYIGTNAQIMPSCKYIGKHSVIGAGSIVTKDVPDYEIWAGNPAKRIKSVKDVRS